MSIRKKMAKGAFWLFLEKGAQQLSSFVVFAVIARMIGPEEYGLVALCAVLISLTINIINGMTDAIVSMHIQDDARLSSLFWLILGGGFAFSLSFGAIAGETKIKAFGTGVGQTGTYTVSTSQTLSSTALISGDGSHSSPNSGVSYLAHKMPKKIKYAINSHAIY